MATYKEGRFLHPCDHPGCRQEGHFGIGVSLLRKRPVLGRWYCHEHWRIHKQQTEKQTEIQKKVVVKQPLKKEEGQGQLL
jgi:hypothetical protein